MWQCNGQVSWNSRRRWRSSIFILHIHSCFTVKARLACISCLVHLSTVRYKTWNKFYTARVTLKALLPNPQKVEFNDSRCCELMYSVIVYAVWVSEHLKDLLKIFQHRQHSKEKINILVRLLPCPWFRTAFRRLGSTLFKTTRIYIIRPTCVPGAESGHHNLQC